MSEAIALAIALSASVVLLWSIRRLVRAVANQKIGRFYTRRLSFLAWEEDYPEIKSDEPTMFALELLGTTFVGIFGSLLMIYSTAESVLA